MGLKTLSPADFGARHKKLFADTIGPLATAQGAKSLSRNFTLELAYARKEGDLGLIYDNVQDLSEVKKGAKLADAYAIDEQLASAAAAQAAKATGGVLNKESARFLPERFRGDYERITGEKISMKNGAAVEGVKISETRGGKVEVDIDFKKALEGVTAREVVLAVHDHFVLSASRLDGAVQDPSLPPYWIVISPRAGGIKDNTQLIDESGMRGFTDPDHGHLIHPGGDTAKLVVGHDFDAKPYATLTFNLDAVNDYGTEVKPPSEKTKAVREGWGKHFKEDEAQFDFSAALSSGTMEEKTLAEVRDLPGIKTLFSAIRENTEQSISKLVKDELLHFYYDTDTKSLAVLRSYDGESGGHLNIIDEAKKRWVGGFSFGDDGTIGWNER
jgi:hypothetical protein